LLSVLPMYPACAWWVFWSLSPVIASLWVEFGEDRRCRDVEGFQNLKGNPSYQGFIGTVFKLRNGERASLRNHYVAMCRHQASIQAPGNQTMQGAGRHPPLSTGVYFQLMGCILRSNIVSTPPPTCHIGSQKRIMEEKGGQDEGITPPLRIDPKWYVRDLALVGSLAAERLNGRSLQDALRMFFQPIKSDDTHLGFYTTYNANSIAREDVFAKCEQIQHTDTHPPNVEQTRGQRQTGHNDLPGRVRELLNGW